MRCCSIITIIIAAIAGGAHAETKIDNLVHQAWKEVESAPKSSVRDAAMRWAERLWELRESAAQNPATSRATAEALQLLAYSGNFDQLKRRADTVAPHDDAWKDGIQALFMAALKEKNYDYLIAKARAVLDSTAGRKSKASVALTLGDAYWRDVEEARQAFSTGTAAR